MGQVGRDLHVSQQHCLATVAVACQTAFFGVVFERQWTSLALPATGLQFLAGNGPFLALSQTRPAAAPHLQNPNGPPWANPGQGEPPNVQLKAPTHLATSAWQGIMGPCNAQCRALGLAPKFGVLGTLHPLCTFHSSFPPFAPPCGPGTPCPGTKMAKPAKMLRHHIVGGQLGCGLGLWATTWQV